MSIAKPDRKVITVSSAIIALLGLWLIISPWIVGAPGPRVESSGVVCGVVILFCSGIRYAYRHTSLFSWINALLGAWLMAAAWIFSEYTGDLRTWNYTIVGMVIAGLEVLSLSSTALRPRASASVRLSLRHPRRDER